ncbi:MAG: bifunctional 3-deoxy-7-phosphoheptulonate synthase/chorismate mutase type II [Bacteroidales bacterium]|nr:bifunctional 3-deoxy-7-phosphoheptulonate synthase/chorismate mutase type II [Bacteroidales bacterium]
MESELDLKPFPSSGKDQREKPLIIAGPCSAESEDQVVATARALKDYGIGVFRAGVWKPRTRPGDFQGIGEDALPWLQKAREETGMQMATEVATPRHVEQALAHKIDILWIGARTTANPFAVEEIAQALQGHDIPVMVKNPISPDLSLWIGAMERLSKRGIRNMAAIHRGFSCLSKSAYRNPPQWDIPLQLKKKVPDIVLLHDPSHIAGQRQLIFKTAKKAMALNMDGLMVEVHPQPKQALSDSNQQLTPEGFMGILHKLGLDVETSPTHTRAELESLRSRIDSLDEALLDIVAKRMRISQEIGNVKQQHHMGIFQRERWQKMISKRIARGRQRGISRELIETVFESIHQESLARQKAHRSEAKIHSTPNNRP